MRTAGRQTTHSFNCETRRFEAPLIDTISRLRFSFEIFYFGN